MEEKKNKSTGKTVVIVLLIIVVIALVGFILYDKKIIKLDFLSKKATNTEVSNTTKETDKSNAIDETTKETLLKQISIYTDSFEFDYPISKISNISNQKMLLFGFGLVTDADKFETGFTAAELNAVLTKYFGQDVKYNNENIVCSVCGKTWYNYDATNKKYTVNSAHGGHGGAGMASHYDYYLSGTYTGDTYTIKMNIVYGDYYTDTAGPSEAYYASANDAKNKTNSIYVPSTATDDFTETEYQSIKDKLNTTTFTFIKDSAGNYGLESVTIK
jgi:hypothetical protein